MPNQETAQVTEDNNQIMDHPIAFEVTIKEHYPESGILANADVKVAGILTIRNVKIKKDDYDNTVVMPRTKGPHSDLYQDCVYFADKSLKEQFDQSVRNAYEQCIHPVQEHEEPEADMEQDEESGMCMEM